MRQQQRKRSGSYKRVPKYGLDKDGTKLVNVKCANKNCGSVAQLPPGQEYTCDNASCRAARDKAQKAEAAKRFEAAKKKARGKRA